MPSFAAILTHIIFALCWVGWLCMLGGAAGMQAKCGGYGPINLSKLTNSTIVPGSADDWIIEDGCSSAKTTSLIW